MFKIQWNLDLEMKKNQSPYKYNLRRNITFQNNVTVYNIQLFTLFLFLFFALKSIHNFWTIWSTYRQVTIYSTTLAYVTRFWIRSKQWLSCIYYVVERKKIYIYICTLKVLSFICFYLFCVALRQCSVIVYFRCKYFRLFKCINKGSWKL